MRIPLIAGLFGMIGESLARHQFEPPPFFRRGTPGRRTRRDAVRKYNPYGCVDRMQQSYKDTDVKLRGFAGAKMARKAKAKSLGIRSPMKFMFNT